MLTEKTTEAPAAPAPAAAPSGAPDMDSLTCYFEGSFVPMRDAKVSVMTHAFMYGTATFEGIRAYWNEEQGKLYGLKVREHAARLRQSCRILMMEDVPSTDELTGLILETVRRNASARTSTSARRSTSRRRRSASGSTTSRTRCTSSRSRSAATSMPRRAVAS